MAGTVNSWNSGDVISSIKLNNIERRISTNTELINSIKEEDLVGIHTAIENNNTLIDFNQNLNDLRFHSLRGSGKNLILDSGPCHRLSNVMHRWHLSEPLVFGETYSFNISLTITGDWTNIYLRASNLDHPSNSGSTTILFYTFKPDDLQNNTLSCTFVYNQETPLLDAIMLVASSSTTVESQINWAKLERGNIISSYTPAPEDDIIDYNNLITNGAEVKTATVQSDAVTRKAFTDFYLLTSEGENLISAAQIGDEYQLDFDYELSGASTKAYVNAFFGNGDDYVNREYPFQTEVPYKYNSETMTGHCSHLFILNSTKITTNNKKIRFCVFEESSSDVTLTISNIKLIPRIPKYNNNLLNIITRLEGLITDLTSRIEALEGSSIT